MKIILIRHAESEANSKGIHQGQIVDTGLSEKGKEQARRLAESLKNEKIEAVYSSDLKRAMETAEAVAKSHNLKVIPDKRLREFDSGDFTHLPDRWDLFKKYKEDESKRLKIERYEVKIPGGESELDHYKRVKDFINEVRNKHKGTIVVVGHGGSNKIVFGVAGYVLREKMYEIEQGNCSVSIIEITSNEFKVSKVNDLNHLT